MQFRDTELPKHPLIEKAFDSAYAKIAQGESLTKAVDRVRDNINNTFDQEVSLYGEVLDKGDYPAQKAKLENERSDYLKAAPQIAAEKLDEYFTALCLEGPVRELVEYGPAELYVSPQDANDHPAVVLMAAAVLLPTVESEADEKKITKAFGPQVGGLIKAVRHLKDDPDAEFYDPVLDAELIAKGDPEVLYENLAASDSLTKALHFANMITGLVRESNDKDIKPITYDRAEDLVACANIAVEIMPELGTRFRKVFNSIADRTQSTTIVMENRVGELNLEDVRDKMAQKIKPQPKPQEEKQTMVKEKTKPKQNAKPDFSLN
jgi:hypothetical protein